MCKYFFKDRIYLKDNLKEKKISDRSFQAFMYADGCYMHTKIDRALNDMVKNKEIIWNEIHVGREYDGTEYGKSHTLTQQEYAFLGALVQVVNFFLCLSKGKAYLFLGKVNAIAMRIARILW